MATEKKITKATPKTKVRLATYAGKNAKGFKDAEKEKKLIYGKFDRQPRFEIDDSTAFMIPVRDITSQKDGVPLGRVFQHPELYKNYPELKDLKVTLQDESINGDPAFAGAFNPRTKTLILRRPTDTELRFDPQALKRTVIHELQHLIQNKEGHAYSTPGTLFDYDNRPGEEEAYTTENRMELDAKQRAEFPINPEIHTKDQKQTVPQAYYTTHEQIESAIKKELDRRLKEKEQMPEGFEHYTTSTSPVYPKRKVLGVIYPDPEQMQPGQRGVA